LAANLHVYVGSLILVKKKNIYYFSKRKGKSIYTFTHFYNEKSLKRVKWHKSTMIPNLPELTCNNPKVNQLLGDYGFSPV